MTVDAVYRQVPPVGCKGLCQASCGPIACHAVEVDAMRDNGINPPAIVDHPRWGPLTCSHLGDDGRCRIYYNRPLVCRLWGAVRKMKCPHGCKPALGYLPDDVARELIHRLNDGRPPHIAWCP